MSLERLFWYIATIAFVCLLCYGSYDMGATITRAEQGESITKLQAVQWCVLNVASSAVQMGADPNRVAQQLPLIAEECTQDLEGFLVKLKEAQDAE